MGSLMAGWDSPTKDPKHVKLMRNKSLTKEKIEDYWKLRKKSEDEHFKAISPVISEVSKRTENFSSKEYRRSTSLPKIDTKAGHLKPAAKEADVVVEDLIKRNGWWTRSNWAFLNEPPVIQSEVPIYKYASQHHVATLGTSKPNSTISNNNNIVMSH
ncbi:hypothetical protein vseg_009181 [Gypsophila vaccaria]